MRRICHAALVVAAAVSLTGCASRYFRDAGPPPEAPQHRLADWPYREYKPIGGENPADLTPLAAWIGNAKIEILAVR